ncbi:MAG: Response regulator MprA [Fimbriimonadaceae bacterium]|nr:Response regulator MprA [Fimbriimonadaceae bacterium]
MRILVVEDDAVLGEQLVKSLTREGFRVDWAKDGEEGVDRAILHPYSLVLLDVMLPKLNGFEVCRSLRQVQVDMPILMLTARDEVSDKVTGLDAGADDYLAKPFAFPELMARIRALTRRSSVSKSAVLQVADLEISTIDQSVKRAGELVHLTPREYSLLVALAQNRGRVLSREVILERVWGDDQSLSNTVNFHVTSLRKKIDSDRAGSLIETVHGFGYRIPEAGP